MHLPINGLSCSFPVAWYLPSLVARRRPIRKRERGDRDDHE